MEDIKNKSFDHKQKLMRDNMAFLWDLKFKYMREQDERYHKRIERVFELKNKSMKQVSVNSKVLENKK